jgi:hypothetical protein
MHMSTNGVKDPQRDIIALKKMQGVSRCKLLNPETTANVNWMPQTAE